MMEPITIFLSGLKIAIFLALFALTFVVDIVNKKHKSIHGLNMMALAFFILALVEFLHILANIDVGVFVWFANHENAHLLEGPLLLISGLGIIWYFLGINKNIKAYR